MSPPLPPELVELILNYVPDSASTPSNLRYYAQAWSIPSQRALFRHLNLNQLRKDSGIVHLPAHLRRYPHLQTYIRHVTMSQTDNNFPVHKGYLAALSALFSLMPRLISMDITFTNCSAWDDSNQRFLKAFGAFLRTSSLDAIVIRSYVYELDLEKVFSYLEDTRIKRVSLQQNTQHYHDRYIAPKKSMVRLPAVEFLRADLCRADIFEEGLDYWISKHKTVFPSLKHLEVAVHQADDLTVWSNILQHAPTLRLESFHLDLASSALTSDLIHPNTNLSLFNGLHFEHLKVTPFVWSTLGGQEFYTWFSARLCGLANSGAHVHFSELTLSIDDDFYLETYMPTTYGARDHHEYLLGLTRHSPGEYS
ncbi:hypothetical protein BDZ89DRAFT_1044233 [Hymenopellis radicata]|nr:hypothetical protein BDZ89DRAFT_1044233 [Hymenopellis radicata]